MAWTDNNAECVRTCWSIAAVIGFVAAVLLYWAADVAALKAIIVGILIAVGLGFGLGMFLCSGRDDAADAGGDTTSSATQSQQPATAAPATAAPATATAATTSAAPTPAAPSTNTVEGTNKAPAATTAPETSKPDAAPASAESVEKAAPRAASTKTKDAAAPEAAAALQDKPALMLEAARPEGKDDLKLISGVGPKLEATLNELGIFHFDQVAKFTAQDVEWVDARVRFKGRITRDDWMSQAKVLAEGGETEFSKKKTKS